MRHQVYGKTLGRKTNHRRAMFRNMAVSLFTHEQITTTVPKAKAVKPFVEKLITAAKKGDLHARRRVIAELGGNRLLVHGEDDDVINDLRNPYGELTKPARAKAPKVVQKLFDDIAPRYADRPGGYTRIVKLGKHRIGDAADLCVLQLVSDEDSGPQVGGQGLRAAKSNKRMEFAAKLRKADASEEAPAEEEVKDDAAVEEVAPEAESTETAEAPAEEAKAEGSDEEKKD